jgi:hypothetical protein
MGEDLSDVNAVIDENMAVFLHDWENLATAKAASD